MALSTMAVHVVIYIYADDMLNESSDVVRVR